eukprot:1161186-Pelagomonas_calceolata.AAC.15
MGRAEDRTPNGALRQHQGLHSAKVCFNQEEQSMRHIFQGLRTWQQLQMGYSGSIRVCIQQRSALTRKSEA